MVPLATLSAEAEAVVAATVAALVTVAADTTVSTLLAAFTVSVGLVTLLDSLMSVRFANI